ncbi:hypothetical protein [Nocardioides montaniterrae]
MTAPNGAVAVLAAVVLAWGLLRLRRASSLHSPVVVDDTRGVRELVVPTSRMSRFYRPVRIAAADVLGVELVPADSPWRGERRWRLAIITTSGQVLSNAITAPYHRDGRPPGPAATSATAALRSALRGSIVRIT